MSTHIRTLLKAMQLMDELYDLPIGGRLIVERANIDDFKLRALGSVDNTFFDDDAPGSPSLLSVTKENESEEEDDDEVIVVDDSSGDESVQKNSPYPDRRKNRSAPSKSSAASKKEDTVAPLRRSNRNIQKEKKTTEKKVSKQKRFNRRESFEVEDTGYSQQMTAYITLQDSSFDALDETVDTIGTLGGGK